MVPVSCRRTRQLPLSNSIGANGFSWSSLLVHWCVILIVISACWVAGLEAAEGESKGNVQDVLVWVKTPQPTALVKGDDLILGCEVRHANQSSSSSSFSFSSSPLLIIYSWSKEAAGGGAIPAKASTYSNHSLFIPRVGDEDLGRYTCTVTIDGWDGDPSASADVIEAYQDPFIVHPQSQPIKVGEPLILTCVTGQSAPYLEVYWTKDGRPFNGGTQMTAAFGDFDEQGLRRQTSMQLSIVASSDLAGIYSCVSRNKLLPSSVLSNPANVSLESVASNLFPVIEWSLPESLVIAEGQNLTLGCTSQVSTEPVETSWFLGRYLVDESKRVYVLRNASLAFLPVMARDAGFYKCRASNSKGSTLSPMVELVIAYILFKFQEEPSDTFALYGQNVVLKCQPPHSLPLASVKWYKDYEEFDVQSRPGGARILDNDLHLDSVTKSDMGDYYCVAVNELTNPSSRNSRVATLVIEGPPQMTQPPARTRLLKGSLLHMLCLAESDPSPTVTWTFEGRPLSQFQDVTIMNNGQELWISNVGKSWEGEFACNCSNKYGSVSASASVTIIVPPVSLQPIGFLNTSSGSSVTISCPVDGFPLPSVQWFHNDTLIRDERNGGAGGGLVWSMDGLDLVIDEVTPEYSGTYECEASNEGGVVTSDGRLVVYVPPYFLEAPHNINKILGQEGILTCRVGGNYLPSVEWFLNNSLSVGGRLSEDNSTLTFSSLSWEDVGKYTCVASNGVGVVKRTAIVSVLVPPEIVSTKQPDGPVQIKSRFVLACGANGIPPPSLKWTHQDAPILPSLNGRVRFPMQGMLVIESALEQDEGVYECKAESVAGDDSVSFSVSVYGRPHPPSLLAAVPLSASSVYLLWEWKADGSRISQTVDSYQLFYRKKASEDIETYPDPIHSNTTRLEVTSLDPGTSYVFYVKATNHAGTSDASNLLTAVTFHSKPSAPTNLRVLEVEESSAVVSWEPPANPNGVVKRYQLRYKREDVSTAYKNINISNPTFPTQEVALQSFRPFYNYTIQARAATLHDNQELWGNFSSPLLIQTKMAVPSLPPQVVRAKAVDANSFSVTWEPIPDLGRNGPVTGYIVVCLDDKKNVVASYKVDKSVDRRTVYGLSPWKQYWVSVKGENLVGVGPESKPVDVRTLPLAPVTIPQQFTAVSHSSTSITLSWKPLPAESVTCNVTEYLVRYQRKVDNGDDGDDDGDGDERLTIRIPSSSTLFTLIDLQPWTPYTFGIAAFTDTVSPGLGPYTELVLVVTLQGASTPVTSVAFVSHSTSVVLSWKPPLDVKGDLIGYSVRHQIVFIDSNSKSVLIPANTTTCVLTGLLFNTTYNISIAARNGGGDGLATLLLVKTLPYIPSTESSLTTTTNVGSLDDSIAANISSSTSGYFSLREDNQESHVKKNLASIVGGSIVGAIAFILIVIFLCAQCKKYRKKQRLSYDVEGIAGADHLQQNQTSTNQQQQSINSTATDHQYLTSTNSTTTTTTTTTNSTTNNSTVATAGNNNSSNNNNIRSQERGKEEHGNGIHQQNDSKGDSTVSQQTQGNTSASEKPKISGLKRFSKPSIFQGQGYNKLNEDGVQANESNGVTATSTSIKTASSVPKSLESVSSSASVEGTSSVKPMADGDNISIMSDTLKRRSRMRSESAAAIAIMRNSQVVNVDDSEGLIDNEIESEVIFNERTVL